MMNTGALGIIQEEFGDNPRRSRPSYGSVNFHSSSSSHTSPRSAASRSANIPVIRITSDHDESFHSSDPEQISLTSFGSPEHSDLHHGGNYHYHHNERREGSGGKGGRSYIQSDRREIPMGGGGGGSYYHHERREIPVGGGGGGSYYHHERREIPVGGGGGASYYHHERRDIPVGGDSGGSYYHHERREIPVGGGGGSSYYHQERREVPIGGGGGGGRSMFHHERQEVPVGEGGDSFYHYERKQIPVGGGRIDGRHERREVSIGGGGGRAGGGGGGGGGGYSVRREVRRTTHNGPSYPDEPIYHPDPRMQRAYQTSSSSSSRSVPVGSSSRRVVQTTKSSSRSPQHIGHQNGRHVQRELFANESDFVDHGRGFSGGDMARTRINIGGSGRSGFRDDEIRITGGRSGSGKDKKFLREVQDELEEQRDEWKNEVEKMTQGLMVKGTLDSDGKPLKTSGANSFVDTSTGHPIFRAFVNVTEFPAHNINVTVDKITNKIVVTAKKDPVPGTLSKTFTQKVQLPRFADDERVRSRLGKDGILSIDVPLIYYFEPEAKKAKSFINRIKTKDDGSQYIEILVNVGSGFKSWELKVQVIEDKELRITGVKDGDGQKQRHTIKRYNLPKNADPSQITSRMGDDGRLVVTVPLIGHPATPDRQDRMSYSDYDHPDDHRLERRSYHYESQTM